jgi:thioredoxin-related protein
MKNLFFIPIFCLLQTTTNWLTNFNEAKKEAAQKHQLILLNFSGSDWCSSCIRLHKEMFVSTVFIQFADSNLVLMNADFPRLNKHQLSKQLQNQNDSLADKYNPNGKFPYTLLMTADGKVLKDWDDGMPKETPQEFIQEIKTVCDANK